MTLPVNIFFAFLLEKEKLDGLKINGRAEKNEEILPQSNAMSENLCKRMLSPLFLLLLLLLLTDVAVAVAAVRPYTH